MLSRTLTKLLHAVVVLLITNIISFSIFSFAGSPVDAMLGETASAKERSALAEELGFNNPVYIRFLDYASNALHGNFGRSLRSNEDIGELIASRFPATLELVIVATALTLIFGIPLGLFSGMRRRSPASKTILLGSLFGISIPNFLLGLLLIYLFAVQLGWLPAFGRPGTVNVLGWETSFLTLKGWSSLILPAASLAVFNIGLYIRLVRAEVLEIGDMDYIRFARARGIADAEIAWRHVLPNSLGPMINVTALAIGSMLAFSLVTETIFQWPGLGLMFIQAIGFSDFPVMAGYFLMVSVIFIVVNLVADISLGLVDPRMRRATL